MRKGLPDQGIASRTAAGIARAAPGRPRPSRLVRALCLGVAIMGTGCDDVAPGPAWQGDTPNIVLILLDEWRSDALGTAGASWLQTPHLDRLAREGTRFSNAFVVQSVCSPSRASMFTGLYPSEHGVTWNGTTLADIPNVLSTLRDVGYTVGYFGKWHLGDPRTNLARWTDTWASFVEQGEYLNPRMLVNGRWVDHDGHLSDILTSYARAFIRTVPGSSPFLLVVSHQAMHEPFIPQPRFEGSLLGRAVPVPASFGDDLADKPDFVRRRAISPDTSALLERLRSYGETLAGADDSVGKILEALEARSVLDNTLVLVVGDNGHMFGEHRLRDKRVAYEESIRIGLIARYPPWFRPGYVARGMALNVDIASTLLDASGRTGAFVHRGRTLRDVADGRLKRSEFLYQYELEPRIPTTPSLRAIRTTRYKYVDYLGADRNELYDLVDDPLELENILERTENTTLVEDLRRRMSALRAEIGDL